MKKIFKNMFDIEHILTPLAVEHLNTFSLSGERTYRVVYIFGIRIAYWSTTKFN